MQLNFISPEGQQGLECLKYFYDPIKILEVYSTHSSSCYIKTKVGHDVSTQGV